MSAQKIDFNQIEEELKRIAKITYEPERETELAALAKATKISKKGLRQRLNQIMREYRLANMGANQRVEIFLDPSESRFSIGKRIYSVMREQPYYLYGGKLALLDKSAETKEGLLSLISKPEDLQGPLLEACDFTEDAGDGNYEHVICPRGFAAAFLKSSFVETFPRIRLAVDITILNEEFKPLKSGYDQISEVYTIGSNIAPAVGTKVIDLVLSEFCFKSQADRVNFLAAMLTTLVHHQDAFIAGVPALNIKANQPGLGKTVLAQILSGVRTGKVARTLSITNDETELEKRICSVLRFGGSMLVFDNAKSSRNLQTISSAVIERTITDRIISYRILGTSTDLTMENMTQVVFTHNGGQFSTDLISRQYPVQLQFEGDPAKRLFKLGDPVRYVLEHRKEIVAELLGMFKVWVEAGRPLADVRHRMQGWASLIGGVLEANHFSGFLANFDEVATEADPYFDSVQQLVATMPVNEALRANNLLTRAQTLKLFGAYFEGRKAPDAASFGKILSQYVGRAFTASGQAVVFKSAIQDGYSKYWIAEME